MHFYLLFFYSHFMFEGSNWYETEGTEDNDTSETEISPQKTRSQKVKLFTPLLSTYCIYCSKTNSYFVYMYLVLKREYYYQKNNSLSTIAFICWFACLALIALKIAISPY